MISSDRLIDFVVRFTDRYIEIPGKYPYLRAAGSGVAMKVQYERCLCIIGSRVTGGEVDLEGPFDMVA